MNYIRIGRVLKPQGIRGEAKIQSLSDDITRFARVQQVFLEQPGGRYEPAGFKYNRADGGMVFAFLDGYYTREAVDGLRNAYLCVPREEAIELDEHSWFIDELKGLDVFVDGRNIGELTDVISTGAVDAYRVKKHVGGAFMFPALRIVIRRVDVKTGEMHLNGEELERVRVDED